ncbi:von Willebrand factor type A domain-containing protein [Saccharothrix texasensis]|uniref:von Willebrand factor type A domain-containing protein n=1 Tax=Saccharothrix texasensis TaxID=103734 RepID=A0A3N1HIL6_9PSEU|nr:von Willebrand factor type A domain-containing protein [Saccharothrix texasensis]
MNQNTRRRACGVTAVLLAALAAPLATTTGAAAADGSVTGTKTLGATDIACGGSVPVTVTLDAQTGIAGAPVDVELVLDRSGSMQDAIDELKTAAKSFVDILDEATDGSLDGVIANGSRVGVVSFSDNASVDAGLTSDANAVKAAIDALVANGLTNHSAAISTGQSQLAGSLPGNAKKMIVMTDGQTTVGGDASDDALAARAAGTEIFGIGLGTVDADEIRDWTSDPDATHYYQAPTPAQLQEVFEAIGAAIVVPAATGVTVVDTVSPQFSVSGAAASKGAVGQNGNQLTWTIDQLGTETVTLTFTATHLAATGGGPLPVNPTVAYTDAEGHVVTFGNPAVNVRGCAAAIDVEPEHAVNELGTPGQTHTVTATVTDDFGDPVPNTPVDFSVLSGPNAGAAGNGSTSGAGAVDFTYPDAQGLAGLGTDSIRGCFTHAAGHQVCDDVLKDWVDTTPPVVTCAPTTNPSGGTTPPADNEDGFFVISATDAVDPNPQVFVSDSASPAVFGGFPSGTRIKLVQAPGATPNQKPGVGAIDWRITLKGDALVYGVDSSGNQSAPVSCLVPPPPK